MEVLGAIIAGFLVGGIVAYLSVSYSLKVLKQKSLSEIQLQQAALEEKLRDLKEKKDHLEEEKSQLEAAKKALIQERQKVLEDAQKEALLKRQEILLKAEAEAMRIEEGAKRKIKHELRKLEQKDNDLNRQRQYLERKLDKLRQQEEEQAKRLSSLEAQEKALQAKEKEIEQTLEKVAGLTREEAREQLLSGLRQEAEMEAQMYLQQVLEEAKVTASEQARKIVLTTIQRIGVEEAVEHSTTTFTLDSDELKGRIIGREGRNIRSFEELTGVELIVDDTPGAIVISSFDPMRREIATRALKILLTDGRVHPGRIEEVVRKVENNIEKEIQDIGRRTLIELSIGGVPAEVTAAVGKMQFRFSYGQNLLAHSKEVARLCAVMASEIGLDPRLAKRAGLFHDIGKVLTENTDQPHALVGMEFLSRFKENPEVLNAVGAHHDEIEMTSLLAPIVQVCDAISGARPGARREAVQEYLQRIQKLESLPKEYPGVIKAYAIQAGRELRILVESTQTSDQDVDLLATTIAQRIQKELRYPGQIKVTVIREKRAQAIAQ